jgi:hypothetical protein
MIEQQDNMNNRTLSLIQGFQAPVFQQDMQGCQPTCASNFRTAIIVKYGPGLKEAAFKFAEVCDAILKKHAVVSDADPTLEEKLGALQKAVGEETFKSMLANPAIERIAQRQYDQEDSRRFDAAACEISAVFNDAFEHEEVCELLIDMISAEDPVAMIAG